MFMMMWPAHVAAALARCRVRCAAGGLSTPSYAPLSTMSSRMLEGGRGDVNGESPAAAKPPHPSLGATSHDTLRLYQRCCRTDGTVGLRPLAVLPS